MTDLPSNHGRSWWLREALAHPEFAGEPCPPLTGDTSADVLILGGGYTGMWTAYHLKEQDPSIDVVLLEQDICGGGPSGRNGGFVNSWWSGLADLCEHVGDEQALALCRAGEESVTAIGTFCERHGVDAWFTRKGDIGVAASPAQIGSWDDNRRAASRLRVPDALRVLSAEDVRARCASPLFLGGQFDPSGATVQPARLARGLRRVLLERDVRIFEGTPVVRFGAGSPVIAETPGGSVRAGGGVIALNAWAGAWKRFRRTLTLRGSYIVLTAPAPERLRDLGWTGGESIWDFRAAIHYLRTTPDGRVAFGIGGMQPGLARAVGPRFAYDARSIAVCAEDLHRMFPSFRDVPLEAAWGGPIDVAATHLPFFGSDRRGVVHHGLGYTGNGVGPSQLGGRILAMMALRADDPGLRSLAIVAREPQRFPPEPVRSPGALVVNQAIRRRDEAQDDGREPDPITDFLAKLPRRLGYNLGP
jgi:glycine/D-amino acid oxidase-like deaminating enzyme